MNGNKCNCMLEKGICLTPISCREKQRKMMGEAGLHRRHHHEPECLYLVTGKLELCNCGLLFSGQMHDAARAYKQVERETSGLELNQPKAPSILEEAQGITDGARQSDYGSAVESFEKIAQVSNLLIGRKPSDYLGATDIVKVLMAVKLVRETFKHKRDNLVDLCGYARLLDDIEEFYRKG